MFKINDDLSIYATRGDALAFNLTATINDEVYLFQPGDVVRIKVFEKKSCHSVVLQKDFTVQEACPGIEISLDKENTKIGELISKPKDYWYEIELNPETKPQTIVGYDDVGSKVFRLFPEGGDVNE